MILQPETLTSYRSDQFRHNSLEQLECIWQSVKVGYKKRS